jgi:hypothetical protein
MFSVTLPILLSITDCAIDVVPTDRSGKVSDPGISAIVDQPLRQLLHAHHASPVAEPIAGGDGMNGASG